MSIDPRAKLCLYCAAITAALITNGPALLLAFLIIALATVGLVRGMRRWLTMLRLLTPMLALLALFALIGGTPDEAAAPVLKLLLLGTVSTAFFAAITVDELGDTLTLLHVPPGVGFVLVGGLRYAPAMRESWAGLWDARRARGAETLRGIRLLAEYARLLAPAVVRALRTADAMAEAMESRGFGASDATLADTYHLRAGDWLVMGAAATVLAVYIVWML